MASDFSITADELEFNLDGFAENEVSTAVTKVLIQHANLLKTRYNRGKKPDGGSQKDVGKNTLNRKGDKHPRQGKPSKLIDQGDLLKSMLATRRGVDDGGRIIFVGTHPTGKLNAQIAKELNDRGFSNTYLSDKDMIKITKDVVTELMNGKLKKLVSIKKKGK